MPIQAASVEAGSANSEQSSETKLQRILLGKQSGATEWML